MRLTFVETRPFTARWHARLDDESLRALQNLLLENPSAGDPMSGCGLLRKLRWSDESRGQGKRGGVRVIYLHTPEVGRIDLVTVYGKDEADDLSRAEIKVLCEYAKQLRALAAASSRPARSTKWRRR